jgi:predicted alpha/beta-hydrolase family hydrolase
MVRWYGSDDPQGTTLALAHGAGAGQEHPWMIRVASGLAARGLRVATFNFRYREAGRGAPDPGPVLEETFVSVWREIAGASRGRIFAGGKSMGGRIASQVAARQAFTPAAAGLVFFGYPLHPPGKLDQRRDRHLPDVTSPMLFLSGTRDPFGSPDELRDLVDRLPHARLETFEGGDHSIVAPKRQDPKGALLERAIEVAAEWMLAVDKSESTGSRRTSRSRR